jgi:predicted RNase H-like HicB family nuclease/transcriptional regulator with XRE-family HTH domain
MASLRERLGRTIRMLRETHLGLTQAQFAHSIESDPSFIGEVERAETNCGIDKLEVIAGGLHLQAWEIIRAAELAPEEPEEAEPSPAGLTPQRRRRTNYRRTAKRKSSAAGEPKGLAREPTIQPTAGSPPTVPLLVVVRQTPDGFSAHVPDLPGCFATAASQDGVEEAVRTAVAAYLQRLRTAGEEMPPLRRYATVIEVPV